MGILKNTAVSMCIRKSLETRRRESKDRAVLRNHIGENKEDFANDEIEILYNTYDIRQNNLKFLVSEAKIINLTLNIILHL